MTLNIGVNVVEVDGKAAPSIAGAALSVAAFNIVTRRGVSGTASRVTSFPQFVERYGSYFNGGYGAYLVKGFFDNGGRTAYINRVVDPDPGTGAAPASVALQDSAPADTLTLAGGFRGQPDPGTWSEDLRVRVTGTASPRIRLRETAPAEIAGNVLAEPIDMTGLPQLEVVIDGAASATPIQFFATDFPGGPASATRALIADAINARTSHVVASISGADELVLRSTGNIAALSGGGFTSLSIPTPNATLGFPAAVPQVDGTPAAIAAGTTQLHRVDEFRPGDAISIQVDPAGGGAVRRRKVLTIDAATNTVTWTPNLAAADIAALTPLVDVRVFRAEFDLAIARAADQGNPVEEHTGLSMESDVANYVETVLNHPLTGSRYVLATDEASPSPPGDDLPAPTTGFLPLTNGRDGTPGSVDFQGDQAAGSGFHAFDAFDVQLVTCERTDAAIASAGLAYCTARGDCMYVGAVPEGSVAAGTAAAYGAGLQSKKAFGALYGPWITVSDPIGPGDNPLISIPPVGHVIGVCARVESTRGVWKAPAGDEANLLGAIGVGHRMSDVDHTALVESGSVNGIRAKPGVGIVIDASRTLSTDTRWRFVNVRLLFNFVKSSLRQGLAWVRQEPNRQFLWDVIKFGSVTPFLMNLYRQGAFGDDPPEDTFTVVIDESNNPPDQVQLGILTIEVYFHPVRPAEKIRIMVGQQSSGSTASEA